MKVFVTGASGHIGSAVTAELLRAGHHVTGLARSEGSATALTDAGAEVLRGDLTDVEVLREGARAADGVIHLAFIHDFADFAGAVRTDREALTAIGLELEGSGKAFIAAGTVPMVAGRTAVETDEPVAEHGLDGRDANARFVLEMANRGVRSSVVRLPHTVHGSGGRGGFTEILIRIAQANGVAGYVGDGSARWPAVPVTDAARLFRLALEGAEAGTVLHAVQDEGVALIDVAGAIGRTLNLPVREVNARSLGFLGALAVVDKPASSALTQDRFQWTPDGPALLANLRQGIHLT